MDTATADPIIAAACSSAGTILVTHDIDFRGVAKRMQVSQRAYRNNLHRVLMRCPEPRSAQRMIEVLPFIELVWSRLDGTKPLTVDVTDVAVRIEHCWIHPPWVREGGT